MKRRKIRCNHLRRRGATKRGLPSYVQSRAGGEPDTKKNAVVDTSAFYNSDEQRAEIRAKWLTRMSSRSWDEARQMIIALLRADAFRAFPRSSVSLCAASVHLLITSIAPLFSSSPNSLVNHNSGISTASLC